MKRSRVVLALAVSLGFMSGAVTAADLSDANLGRTIGATCSGCHGFQGVSQGAAPTIKGMDAAAMVGQMKAFKSGERPSTIMDRIAKGYSDSEIDAVAQYFSNLK